MKNQIKIVYENTVKEKECCNITEEMNDEWKKLNDASDLFVADLSPKSWFQVLAHSITNFCSKNLFWKGQYSPKSKKKSQGIIGVIYAHYTQGVFLKTLGTKRAHGPDLDRT